MLKHYVGLTAQKATMLSLDRLGINLLVEKEGHTALRVRLPFPRCCAVRRWGRAGSQERRGAVGLGSGSCG